MLKPEISYGRGLIYVPLVKSGIRVAPPVSEKWLIEPASDESIPPFNFLPGLLSQESLRKLEVTKCAINEKYRSLLGKPVDLGLYKSYLKLPGIDPDWVPWDIFTSVMYKDINIAGPIMVSFSHRVMSRPTSSESERNGSVRLATHHLANLARDWKLVVISMPRRKEESLTHKMFVENFGAKFKDGTRGDQPSTRYYLKGDSLEEKKFEELFEDEILSEIFEMIGSAWLGNFHREIANAEKSKPELDDLTSLLLQRIFS